MQIRQGNADDLSDVRALSERATEACCLVEELDETTTSLARDLTDAALDAFAAGIGSDNHSVYVAAHDDVLLGYVIAIHDAPEIRWIVVDPTAQGSGAGKALMIAALDALAERGVRSNVRLTVPVNNERAKAFYRKFGFMVTGPVNDHQVPMLEMQRAA
ncbi:GNAT family N-acetyltransferase [Thalassospira indica]|uniref:GNAT family N-acetyltransferase n=1 Tax=Thalassospira indica TaxID=1891279 RepID=A0ABM6Y0L7_9PROT|nr:GNAT family N-acetyltransferase [Thalassospira indica]AXO13935.1 GNAT family N-acetyltransferase [Thalassospira indica]OAZ13038.1 GNAT family acetyltransferase [Thalassospira profundimaris]